MSNQLRPDAERLADIFTILQRGFVLKLSKQLAKGHLSFPQYLLLSFLSQSGELSMSDIAKRMGHTTAAATGLVDRLEKLDFVQRVHAKDDRRKIMVHATQGGQDLVMSVREDMIENLLKLLDKLEPEEQKMWVRIYEKVILHAQ